jgi:hypothetical protein
MRYHEQKETYRLPQEIRVNWAYQSNSTSKEDTSNHFHIFVGDLSIADENMEVVRSILLAGAVGLVCPVDTDFLRQLDKSTTKS